MLQIFLIFLIIAALSLGVDPIQKIFPKKRARRLLWTAFSVYILGNLYFTILSRTAGTGTYVDPRPFGTYLRMSETVEAAFQNATGFAAFFLNGVSSVGSFILNVLLYYPMGYLLAVLFPKLKPWQIILIGCAASCTTELTQYLLKMGWCEVDDILTNTLGTAIGLCIRRLQDRLVLKRK